MTSEEKQASANLSALALESASRLNAAIWTGYASAQAASLAARTPGPWSVPGAVLGGVSAAASFTYAGVELSNLILIITEGTTINATDAEKIDSVLEKLEEPISSLIETFELLLTGSDTGSDLHAALDAAKEALDTLRTSSNVAEKAAALQNLFDAVEELFSSPLPTPAPQPAEEQEAQPGGHRDPLDLQPSEFGPLAGEPYHDPGVAYV